MSMFYYLAVSGADNRRMNGQIDAVSEAAARSELNRMGLSVLSISDKAPEGADAGQTTSFEFEALDRTQKKVAGTIDAADLTSAFTRLKAEFSFQVSYICRADATPSEKTAAHTDGIEKIKKEAATAAAIAALPEKKNITESLSSFVKKAEEKLQQASGTEREQTGIRPEPAKEESNEALKERPVTLQREPEKAQRHKLTTENPQLIKSKVETQANEFTHDDFDFNQDKKIEEMTQAAPLDLTQEKIDLAPNTEEVDTKKTDVIAVAHRKAEQLLHELPVIIEAFSTKVRASSASLFATELLNTLIIFYVSSFVILKIATGYDLGSLSSFATQIVDSSMLLAFWAFVFLTARLLLSAQQKLQERAVLRTSLMCGIAVLSISFMGINLL